MSNRDVRSAWAYHEQTKHSYSSIRSGAHFLDWANKPLDHKIYPGLPPISLAAQMRPTGVPALEAIASVGGGDAAPDFQSLAQVLFFSAGITRRRQYPGGEILFRAASCTGALYEFELNVACVGISGLDDGLYHFAPTEMALRKLRSGDCRPVGGAPAVVICAGTYWRNAWKYQARTYRHFGWDNGTMLANTLAESAALGLPAKVLAGFVDRDVNHLLGVNAEKEVAFSLVTLGRSTAPFSTGELPSLQLDEAPLSRREVDYPMMREMHQASSLLTAEEAAAWRGSLPRPSSPAPMGQIYRLTPPPDSALPGDTIEEVILRRGSTRVFAREAISFAQLSAILDRSTRGIPADFSEDLAAQLNDIYLIVNAVDGLPSGSYYYRQQERALECLKESSFRDTAGYLGLEQDLPADCSVAVFFLADLKRIFERFGNRGYRAVQLEAGILGGKMYLAAYAQRLGASGLTFYDDEVTKFFSPHAEGKSANFLMTLGKSARR